MCQCGCSEGIEFARFPGPGKSWYFLEFHTGCSGCEIEGGGFGIRHSDSLEDYEKDTPVLAFVEYGDGKHFSFEIPTIGRQLRDLAAVRQKMNEESG